MPKIRAKPAFATPRTTADLAKSRGIRPAAKIRDGERELNPDLFGQDPMTPEKLRDLITSAVTTLCEIAETSEVSIRAFTTNELLAELRRRTGC